MSSNNYNNLFNNKPNIKTNNKPTLKSNNVNVKPRKTSKLMMILILFLVLYLFYLLYRNVMKKVTSYTPIVKDIRQGIEARVPMSGKLFPYPNDGQYGNEFTYTTWLYINGTNFQEKQTSTTSGSSCGNSEGKYRCIFVKGSGDYSVNSSGSHYPLLQAPGLWIYPYDNKLAINMNTYSSTKETCDIGNIPVGKWFHLVIMLIGNSLDIYINGQLKKRCTLQGVPKLNYGDLYLTPWGGFDGYISKFYYYNRALQQFEIERAFNEGPSNELPKGQVQDKPPYLAQDYWMTTGFPSSTH